MAIKAKEFRYEVHVDRAGQVAVEAHEPTTIPESLSPEHLVLAGLVRCTLTSLAYHARRLGLDVEGAGSASGLVTRREADGRYAFAEIDVELALELDSPLDPDQLSELLARAERDCFVGASLRVTPRYRWTVDGVVVSARAEPS